MAPGGRGKNPALTSTQRVHKHRILRTNSTSSFEAWHRFTVCLIPGYKKDLSMRVYNRRFNACSTRTHVTEHAEIQALFACMQNTENTEHIVLDPAGGSHAIRSFCVTNGCVPSAKFVSLEPKDGSAGFEKFDFLSPSSYYEHEALRKVSGIVCSPPFALIDQWFALCIQRARDFVLLHVPSTFPADRSIEFGGYFQELVGAKGWIERRVYLHTLNVRRGTLGKCYWLCMFRNKKSIKKYWRGSA